MNVTICALIILKTINSTDTNYRKAAEILCTFHKRIIEERNMTNKTAITLNSLKRVCCSNTTILEQMCVPYLLHSQKFELKCMRNMKGITHKDQLEAFNVATYTLTALLIPMGLIGNILILYGIFKLRCLPLQTGYFLSSLALADLGVIFLFGACFIYNEINITLPDRVEMFLIPSFDIFFGAISLLQITLISIERAVAVTWPLKYPSYISVRRAKRIVYIIWFFSFFLFLYSLSRIFITSEIYSMINFFITVSILLCIPILVIITSYTLVLVCAYKNLSQDRQRIKMLTLLFKSNKNSAEDNNNRSKSSKFSSLRCREVKLAINVAMLVLPFLGCWGYFLFAHMYEVLTDYMFTGVANWLIFILPFIVSCLNPCVYLVFTRSLRKSVKTLIKRNVKSKLSRTELSLLTLSTINSRRTSSISGGSNRKVGRDFSDLAQKDVKDIREQLMKLYK